MSGAYLLPAPDEDLNNRNQNQSDIHVDFDFTTIFSWPDTISRYPPPWDLCCEFPRQEFLTAVDLYVGLNNA